jgi:hypothetical protein
MAEIDILVDVRFIEIDQRMLLISSAIQSRADLADEAFTPLGIRPRSGLMPCQAVSRLSASEQFLGLLPRQVQPAQGAADGLTAATASEPFAHERDQTPQCPAWFWIGPGYGWCGCCLPSSTDFFAKRCFDLRAKGGRPPVRR